MHRKQIYLLSPFLKSREDNKSEVHNAQNSRQRVDELSLQVKRNSMNSIIMVTCVYLCQMICVTTLLEVLENQWAHPFVVPFPSLFVGLTICGAYYKSRFFASISHDLSQFHLKSSPLSANLDFGKSVLLLTPRRTPRLSTTRGVQTFCRKILSLQNDVSLFCWRFQEISETDRLSPNRRQRS